MPYIISPNCGERHANLSVPIRPKLTSLLWIIPSSRPCTILGNGFFPTPRPFTLFSLIYLTTSLPAVSCSFDSIVHYMCIHAYVWVEICNSFTYCNPLYDFLMMDDEEEEAPLDDFYYDQNSFLNVIFFFRREQHQNFMFLLIKNNFTNDVL